MENFDLIRDNILSFHIGVVKYEDRYYAVVRDTLINNAPSREYREVVDNLDGSYKIIHHKPDPDDILNIPQPHKPNQIIKEAIYELLSYDHSKAITKVGYIKSIINELQQFKNVNNDTVDAFLKFISICVGNMINYHGPLTNVLNNLVITQNFIDDLSEEIAIRLDVITDIENALSKAFKSEQTQFKPEVWFDEARYIRAADYHLLGKGNLLPNELTFKEWENICKSDLYHNDNTSSKMEAVDNNQNPSNAPINIGINSANLPPGKKSKKSIDFKKDALNDAGRKIYSDLIKTYSNDCAPSKIVYMLFALAKENLLSIDVKNYYGSEWVRILGSHFGKTFERKSLEHTLKKLVGKYDSSTYQPGIDIEIAEIKKILSKVS